MAINETYLWLMHVIISDTNANITPAIHTPSHCFVLHAQPAHNVPILPPTKRWNMKMVLLRLVACGVWARQPLWLLSWWHCAPMSTRIMVVISPT